MARPASETLAQAISGLLGPDKKTKSSGKLSIISQYVPVILELIRIVEDTRFSRRELQTWIRRLRRWRKRPAVKNTPNVSERVARSELVMASRLRHTQ